MGFYFLRENYTLYYEKIICWCGSGTDQVRNLYSEERSALEHIVGSGTDQVRNLYSEKRVGEICIFFYFLAHFATFGNGSGPLLFGLA